MRLVEIRSFLTKCHLLSNDVDFRCVFKRYETYNKQNAFTGIFSLLKENLNWPFLAGGNDFQRDENGLSRKTEQDSITLVIPVTSWNTKTAHYLRTRDWANFLEILLWEKSSIFISNKKQPAMENILSSKFIPFLEVIFWCCNKAYRRVRARLSYFR